MWNPIALQIHGGLSTGQSLKVFAMFPLDIQTPPQKHTQTPSQKVFGCLGLFGFLVIQQTKLHGMSGRMVGIHQSERLSLKGNLP